MFMLGATLKRMTKAWLFARIEDLLVSFSYFSHTLTAWLITGLGFWG
jgi:hypothetical protein